MRIFRVGVRQSLVMMAMVSFLLLSYGAALAHFQFSGGGGAAIPTMPAEGYRLYQIAKQTEAAHERELARLRNAPNGGTPGEQYDAKMRWSGVFNAYRAACDARYGLACVDMARLDTNSISKGAIWLSKGCVMGYRPACRTPQEIANFDRQAANPSGAFQGQGAAATAEEIRLKGLCDRSQWASCTGFAKLAAPRLLRNCEMGNQDSCMEYHGAATTYNLAELKPIWLDARALPAMRRHCETTTRKNAPQCDIARTIEGRIAFNAMPATSAGTTQVQRQACLRAVVGIPTGRYTQSVLTEEDGSKRYGPAYPVTVPGYQNICRYPVTGRCGDDASAKVHTIAGLSTDATCPYMRAI